MDIDQFAQTDVGMFLALGSVAYVFIIYIRGARIMAIRAGWESYIKEVTIIAVVMAIAGLSFGEGVGWAMAIFSLLTVTIFIAVYTIITGGMAAGALLRRGVIHAIPAVLLIAATISLGFIEPLIAAPFCTLVLGLNIYLEYTDMYGVLYHSLWRNEVMHYIFVYPPFVLLFTLTDILAITPVLGQTLMAFVVTATVVVGMVAGYQKGSY